MNIVVRICDKWILLVSVISCRLSGAFQSEDPYVQHIVFITGRICFADRKLGSNKADVIKALNEAIDLRDEGIMIKRPDAPYKPGCRKNSGWIKVKPEYQTDLADTCDLVILGGYYSEGKRHRPGTVSHFLLGIRDGDTFRSFSRVGSGVSNKELFDLDQRLQPHYKVKKQQLAHVKYGKERPDVKIDPRKSVVLEIRAAEVVKSSSMDAGYTLR